MKKFITLTSILLVLVSCNSVSISNEEVLEIFKKEELAQDCYFTFTKRTLSNWESYNNDLKNFNNLVDLGLMTKSREYRDRLNPISNYYTVVEFEYTQKAISEYGFENAGSGFGGPKGRVIFSKANIVEVVGVSINEEQKEATAIVRIDYEKTPFSVFKGEKEKPYGCDELTTQEIELKLKKFDTGWKIQKEEKKGFWK